MKMEKIAQLLEMASNKQQTNCQQSSTTSASLSTSTQSTSLNSSKTVNMNTSSDINSTFNLIAGNLFVLLNKLFKFIIVSRDFVLLFFFSFWFGVWCWAFEGFNNLHGPLSHPGNFFLCQLKYFVLFIW